MSQRLGRRILQTAAGLLGLLSLTGGAWAGELRLARLFSDHAVLQRERPVPVWGWASAGDRIAVSFAGQRAETTADATGRWQVQLKPLKASFEPRRLTVAAGGETVSISDVLVGEVWYVGGQSNMDWRLVHSDGGQRAVAESDVPGIRLMLAEQDCAAEPRAEVTPAWAKEGEPAAWQPSRPWSANKISAVGSHMATELRRELGVPIGLIQTSVGGARIEAWMPAESFRQSPALAKEAAWLDQARAQYRARKAAALRAMREWLARTGSNATEVSDPPAWPYSVGEWYNQPSCFYNGMVSGLLPYGIAGMAWYQGEANVTAGEGYATRLRLFMEAMRKGWQRPDLPIALVQLAPYQHPQSRKLPLVWEAQLDAARTPNVGLVTISDLVTDVTNLHPSNKRDVGRRLARWALAEVYHRPDVTPTGPLYRNFKVENGKVRITFDNADGLTTRYGNAPDNFEIAGPDGRYVGAEAKIDGRSVVVSSSAVPNPAAVRFSWWPTAQPNLVNAAGLPAAAFRTHRDTPQ